MKYKEDSNFSFQTVLTLIDNEFRKKPSSEDAKKRHRNKIHFLIDDLLTKSRQINWDKERIFQVETIDSILTSNDNYMALDAKQDTEDALVKEYQSSFSLMQAQKISIDIEIDRLVRKYKCIYISVLVLYLVFNVFLVVKLGWEVMEQYTYLCGIGFLVLSYCYIVYKGKDFNPVEYFRLKEDAIRKKVCTLYCFDANRYAYLKEKVQELSASGQLLS
jgi:hypothetical protein